MRNEGRITTIREALAASEMSRTPTLFNLGGLVIEFSFPRKSHGSGQCQFNLTYNFWDFSHVKINTYK